MTVNTIFSVPTHTYMVAFECICTHVMAFDVSSLKNEMSNDVILL